jgi:hypothetical protein
MKTSYCTSIMAATALLCLVPSLRAQAVYTATKSSQLQAGAGYLYLNNDYTPKNDQGVSAWVDASLTPLIGIEAEGHLGNIVSPSDVGENSAFIGPRVTHRFGRLQPYVKAMIGVTALKQDLPEHTSTAHYVAYEIGGGVDYRVKPHFSWRVVDVGFQGWPNFKPNGLSPYAISTGVMYIIQ